MRSGSQVKVRKRSDVQLEVEVRSGTKSRNGRGQWKREVETEDQVGKLRGEGGQVRKVENRTKMWKWAVELGCKGLTGRR
jgi:hypothetical protein